MSEDRTEPREPGCPMAATSVSCPEKKDILVRNLWVGELRSPTPRHMPGSNNSLHLAVNGWCDLFHSISRVTPECLHRCCPAAQLPSRRRHCRRRGSCFRNVHVLSEQQSAADH